MQKLNYICVVFVSFTLFIISAVSIFHLHSCLFSEWQMHDEVGFGWKYRGRGLLGGMYMLGTPFHIDLR